MSPRGAHSRAGEPPRAGLGLRLVRNVLLWLLPVAAVWAFLTPYYNHFLTTATENLVRLSESPAVTRLAVARTHYFLVSRTDLPASRGQPSVRVTDAHFPLILLAALFLGVPGLGARTRLEPLGWALLVSVFLHILTLFFWVKFTYATQLGAWSVEHYGPWARNFWGMGKHLLDLPVKLAAPLALWAAFHLRYLLPPVDRRAE